MKFSSDITHIEKTLPDKIEKDFRKGISLEDFNVLVNKYQNLVLNVGYSYFSNWHDAEEIAQKVFIKVYKNISKFRGDASFMTWLYRITINICIDYGRKQTKRPWFGWLNMFADNDKSKSIIDKKGSVRKTILQKEVFQIIDEIVDSLPAKQKAIFNLFYHQNLPVKEIANILKTTNNNVKSILSQSRKKIREHLSKKEISSIWEN